MLRLIGYSADCDQRQFQAEGVRHVGGNAGEAVKKGKGAEGCARKLAPHGKADRQQRWDNQLEQCSTPEPKRLAKPAKEKRPALMKGKVDIIAQRQLPPMERQVQQKQTIEHEPAGKLYS